ncbi:unnamed protein product [Brassica rapa]|uniref:Reticulon-like protein n=2 Tax=Brassica TaxID=3705 RepID=A0A817AG34_BRANA|nr:unnamed protein product [Brassica napus]CAG7905204.1 unnamed protein product [Brassica rapa]VDD10160.1 unnamed protein product [Brassica rapa]
MFSGLHLKFLKSILKTKFPFDCFCTEKRAEQGLCYLKEHCVRKGLEKNSDVIHILVINRFLVNNLYLFGQYSLDFYSQVVVGLWIISVVGKLVQLLDRCFVLLHTVPMMYEKHEDKVDPVAEKRMKELKKHYVVFDDKVLSKVPLASLKAKLG